MATKPFHFLKLSHVSRSKFSMEILQTAQHMWAKHTHTPPPPHWHHHQYPTPIYNCYVSTCYARVLRPLAGNKPCVVRIIAWVCGDPAKRRTLNFGHGVKDRFHFKSHCRLRDWSSLQLHCINQRISRLCLLWSDIRALASHVDLRGIYVHHKQMSTFLFAQKISSKDWHHHESLPLSWKFSPFEWTRTRSVI